MPRSLRSSLGGLATHAKYGPDFIAARARVGFNARFEHEVDPEGVLDPQDRRKRAEIAKRDYFKRLAHKSAEARRARKEAAA